MSSPAIPLLVSGVPASLTGAPLKRERANRNADLGLSDTNASHMRSLARSVAHLNAIPPVMTPQERHANRELLQIVAFTSDMWAQCIGDICDGVPCAEAVQRAGIPATTLEGFIRTDVRIRAQWEEAKLTALRRHWPLQLVEDILEDIATGDSVKQAVQVKRGLSYVGFLKLTSKDPIVEEMYLEAKKLQAETFADDIVEEATEEGNDVSLDGKGNIAAVNRSKLRVNTKQWLMQANAPKRFRKPDAPTQVNVQVVNHAERLEEARRRRETTVTEVPSAMDPHLLAVDAAFTDKPSWDDL